MLVIDSNGNVHMLAQRYDAEERTRIKKWREERPLHVVVDNLAPVRRRLRGIEMMESQGPRGGDAA
jgi:hypothetical protein